LSDAEYELLKACEVFSCERNAETDLARDVEVITDATTL
jgi:hypothetical protein